MSAESANAPECTAQGCFGVAVKGGRCLAHLGPDLGQTVRELCDARQPLVFRACDVALIEQVLAMLPRREGVPYCHGIVASNLSGRASLRLAAESETPGLPISIEGSLELRFSEIGDLDLAQATVGGDCKLIQVECGSLDAHGVTFRGRVSGEDLTVSEDLDVSLATAAEVGLSRLSVGGAAKFSSARMQSVFLTGAFEGVVTFHNCTVDGDLDLSGSSFGSHLSLNSARVGGLVDLRGAGAVKSLDARSATVGGSFYLSNLTFSTEVDLARSEVKGMLAADGCTFHSDASFREMRAYGDLNLAAARFLGQIDFGGAFVKGETANLTKLRADSRLDLALWSPRVDLTGAHFRDGLDLRLGDTAVRLDDTRFDAASLISGPELKQASVVSMQRARLSNLSLAHVDLSGCLMAGVAGLDMLQLGDGVAFPRAPGMAAERLATPGRQVIADEICWHQAREHSVWQRLPRPDEAHPELRQARESRLDPAEIEELYRALRIARERSGNAPGAADFYYGEMEMRRMRRWSEGWAEKLIVLLYWALSGYGLRASRSLLSIAVLWAAGAFFFLGLGGFVHTAALGETLVFTAASGLAFLHEPPDNITVTTAGEAAQLVLRIGTAILLAMATLALRGRVKRW